MHLLSLLLAGFCTLAPAAPQDPPAVPRQATPSLQLQHARQVKSAARGTRGAARIEALDRAVAAYAAVTEYWPEPGPVAAEAAFRRGEIQRSLGREGPARASFLEVLDLGPGTAFHPRALLELGHLRRRAGEYGQALERYRQVLEIQGVPLRYANDSREWTARVLLDTAEWKGAAEAARSWKAHAEGPVEIVRAADLEARALAGQGLLDEASRVLEGLREDLADLAADPTPEGEALQRAFERMKAPAEIEKARASSKAVSQPASGF